MPGLVQVDEDIDAPQESAATVHVEVRVHVELAAGKDLMKGAAPEMRVGNQACYAGEPLKEVKERHLVEFRQHATNLGLDAAKVALLRAAELSDLVRTDVRLFKVRMLRLGEAGEAQFGDVVREEVVHDDVGEGLCIAVRVGEVGCRRQQLRAEPGKEVGLLRSAEQIAEIHVVAPNRRLPPWAGASPLRLGTSPRVAGGEQCGRTHTGPVLADIVRWLGRGWFTDGSFRFGCVRSTVFCLGCGRTGGLALT